MFSSAERVGDEADPPSEDDSEFFLGATLGASGLW